jgi:hypothetical protein
VKTRYESARKCFGLSAPESSFDYMLNFVGNEGHKISLQNDGRVTITAFSSDRNTQTVEYETSEEEKLTSYLLDRLTRSCVVRDMLNDPQVGTISAGKYLEIFETLRVHYSDMLLKSGIIE